MARRQQLQHNAHTDAMALFLIAFDVATGANEPLRQLLGENIETEPNLAQAPPRPRARVRLGAGPLFIR